MAQDVVTPTPTPGEAAQEATPAVAPTPDTAATVSAQIQATLAAVSAPATDTQGSTQTPTPAVDVVSTIASGFGGDCAISDQASLTLILGMTALLGMAVRRRMGC